MATEDELLERLARLRRVPDQGPSDAERAAARAAFEASAAHWRRPGAARTWGTLRRVALVAALPIIVLGLVTLLSNERPAESSELQRARAGVAALLEAMEERDTLRTTEAAAELRRRVAALTPDERQLLEPDVDGLLREAERVASSASGSTPTSTSTSTPPRSRSTSTSTSSSSTSTSTTTPPSSTSSTSSTTSSSTTTTTSDPSSTTTSTAGSATAPPEDGD